MMIFKQILLAYVVINLFLRGKCCIHDSSKLQPTKKQLNLFTNECADIAVLTVLNYIQPTKIRLNLLTYEFPDIAVRFENHSVFTI